MEIKKEPISLGCQVEIELVDRSGSKEHLSILIVQDKSADLSKGYISENSPIARALLGEHSGTVIPYLKDDILSIEILAVSRPSSLPVEDAAKQRQAKMKKTIRDVENTNAVVFASSFSGKWGDYDPDSIPKEDLEDEESPE